MASVRSRTVWILYCIGNSSGQDSFYVFVVLIISIILFRKPFRDGRTWKIPVDAVKPSDGRYKSKERLFENIDRKKVELNSRRPMTEGEVERLAEEFIVEYTYNSNATPGGASRFIVMAKLVEVNN